jgi:uncharacterized protein (TIGR02466 family)
MSKKPLPATITPLFVTETYRASLNDTPDFDAFLEDLDDTCRAIADEDDAGHEWCAQKAYPGYTSYGSIHDLTKRASLFEDLKRHLDVHAAAFAEALEFDLQGRKLRLDNIWINILDPGGHHSNHLHPHSVISGTFYVDVPEGAASLKFEDPRLDRFMNAPPRKAGASKGHEVFVYEAPTAGTVLMWESWLRHEVPANLSEDVRISISFNYAW